jgi:hypothetical protein
MRRVALLVAVAAAVSFVGGFAVSAFAAPLPAGAVVAPRDSAVFVSVDLRSRSGQVAAAVGLVRRVPGLESMLTQLLQQALKGVGGSGLPVNGLGSVPLDRVAPLLGPELDVVVRAHGRSADAVALLQPSAVVSQALQSVLGTRVASRTIEGWTAIARSKADLDRYVQALAAGRLSAGARFRRYMGAVSRGAPSLVRLFVNTLAGQLSSLGGGHVGAGAGARVMATLDRGVTAAVALRAERAGVRIESAVPAAGASRSAVTLDRTLPAGASVAVDATVAPLPAGAAAAVLALPQLRAGLGRFEQLTGVSIVRDLLPLLPGEFAATVSPAAGAIPSVLVVHRGGDPVAAVHLADRLATAAEHRGLVTGRGIYAHGVFLTELTVNNLRGGRPLSIYYGIVNGDFVVSTSTASVIALQGAGPRLADDSTLKAARIATRTVTTPSAFAIADLPRLEPLLLRLIPAHKRTPPPPGLHAALAALGPISAFTHVAGSVSTTTAFIAIH